jgi:circadian clock protein KaiC
MLLDDLTADVADKTVHSLAHGVIRLEERRHLRRGRRRIRIIKYRRQIPRLSRRHSRPRLNVFPRLVAPNSAAILCSQLSSGIGRSVRCLAAGSRPVRARWCSAPHRLFAGRDHLPARRTARGEKAAMFVLTGTRPVAARMKALASPGGCGKKQLLSSGWSTPPKNRPANSLIWSASCRRDDIKIW